MDDIRLVKVPQDDQTRVDFLVDQLKRLKNDLMITLTDGSKMDGSRTDRFVLGHDGRLHEADGDGQGVNLTLVYVDGDDPHVQLDMALFGFLDWHHGVYSAKLAGWDSNSYVMPETKKNLLLKDVRRGLKAVISTPRLNEAAWDEAFESLTSLENIIDGWPDVETQQWNKLDLPQPAIEDEDNHQVRFTREQLNELHELVQELQAELYKAIDMADGMRKHGEPGVSVGWEPYGQVCWDVCSYNLSLDRPGRVKHYGPYDSAQGLLADMRRVVDIARRELWLWENEEGDDDLILW